MVINATNLVVRKKYDNTNFLILLGRIQIFSNIQNRGGNTIVHWYSWEIGSGPAADTKLCGCSSPIAGLPYPEVLHL